MLVAVTTWMILAALLGAGSTRGMVLVPGGKFVAGAPAQDSPMTLEPFFIDATEVTQEDYATVMGDRPVEKVNWFDAAAYCDNTGKRLPTEWEWEMAARAGTVTKFYWGNAADGAYGWHRGNAQRQTHAVGLKKPNALGLYDMAGNVWEWTASDFGGAIPGKVLRGGSWRNGASSMRSSSRITSLPHYKYHYAGFRCAKNAD
jgi:sulfatase modifying factor 1